MATQNLMFNETIKYKKNKHIATKLCEFIKKVVKIIKPRQINIQTIVAIVLINLLKKLYKA